MVFLAMSLLVLLTNVIAFQYAFGAIRTSVDEAARLGARLDGTVAECESHADEVLRGETGLLQGLMGQGIVFDCTVEGAVMVASASGELDWWFGGVPPLTVDLEGRSVIEPAVEAAP